MPRKTRDIVGSRFGRYKVIKQLPSQKRRNGGTRSVYLCLCDCGTTRDVSGSSLLSGNTESCGCKRADTLREQKRLRPYEWLYNLTAGIAKRREMEFTLSYEDFVHLTEQEECTYCGSNIRWKEFSNNRSTEGYGYNLDRKNSSLGYSLDNCVACCGVCNQGKNDLPVSEFKDWILRCYAKINSGQWPN